MSNSVERKIYFYRVDAGRDDQGHQVPFNPVPTLQHLNTLTWTADGRYSEDLDGNATACWIDDPASPLPKMRLGKLRRNGLPHLEQGGTLTDLSIPQGAGLAEQTHIMFFANNIVGADFNYYAPRATSLKYYFAEKARGICPAITLEQLLSQDTSKKLNSLGDIRLFDLKLDPPSAAELAQADTDLSSLLNAAINLGHTETMEIVMRPLKYSKKPINYWFLDKAKQILKQPSMQGSGSSLTVGGRSMDNGGIEYFDIFNDQLVSKKKIVLMNDNTRTLNHAAAYVAIQEAFTELEAELLEAVGIRP